MQCCGFDCAWGHQSWSHYSDCWVCVGVLEGDGDMLVDGVDAWLGCGGWLRDINISEDSEFYYIIMFPVGIVWLLY